MGSIIGKHLGVTVGIYPGVGGDCIYSGACFASSLLKEYCIAVVKHVFHSKWSQLSAD